MNAGYIVLIALTCLVPVLVNLAFLTPRFKAKDDAIKQQTFEDYMFQFQTKFIQTMYNISTYSQSISPQSAFMMLMLMGYGAPENIRDQLHDGMELGTVSFNDLRRKNGHLRVVSNILRKRYMGMRQVLGWSWKMTNYIDQNCTEQDNFVEVLQLFNSSIDRFTENTHRIQTVTTESFQPLLHWFRVNCIMVRKARGPRMVSIVVNGARVGQLSSIDNVEFYELIYRKTNQNVSIIFLNPNGTHHLNSMLAKFGKLKYEDFVNAENKLRRINLTMPLGNWTIHTGTSEFRPFFTETLPSYTQTNNMIEGNFERVCDPDDSKDQSYEILGQVDAIFRLGLYSPPRLPKCDEKLERRRKSSTTSFVLKYPFVVMIMVDKSIVYFSVTKTAK